MTSTKNGSNILKEYISNFLLTEGIFEPPPQVVEKIYKRCATIYCEHLLTFLPSDYIEKLKNDVEEDKNDEYSEQAYQDSLNTLKVIHQYTYTPFFHRDIIKFPVSIELDKWKYFNKIKKIKPVPKKSIINVEVYPRPRLNFDRSGAFFVENWDIEIILPLYPFYFSPSKSNDFGVPTFFDIEEKLTLIYKIVYHEVIHLGQYIFYDLTGKFPTIKGDNISKEPFISLINPNLNDIEFEPRMKDEIQNIKRDLVEYLDWWKRNKKAQNIEYDSFDIEQAKNDYVKSKLKMYQKVRSSGFISFIFELPKERRKKFFRELTKAIADIK